MKYSTKKASEIRKAAGITTNNVPVAIISLATKYGFTVFELPIEEKGLKGLILSHSKKINGFNTNKIIIINPKLPLFEKRFVIAEALCNYLLEDVEKRKKKYCHCISFVPESRTIKEKKAEKVAAELLIPVNDAISFNMSAKSKDIDLVAKYFSDIYEVPIRIAYDFIKRHEIKKLMGPAIHLIVQVRGLED